MSDGHSTARSLSRIECLNEWITHPSGTLYFSQLLMAAEAELALLMTLCESPRVIENVLALYLHHPATQVSVNLMIAE